MFVDISNGTRKKITDNSKPGLKTENGGEIFSDYENNKAYSKNSSAFGTNTIAGGKAFKIVNIDYENLTFTFLSTTPLRDLVTESNSLEYSCQITNNYSKCGNIIEILDETTVKVDIIPQGAKGTSGTLWIPSNPELGDGETFVGRWSFVSGHTNKANQDCSASFGYNNTSDGKYSFTAGRDNFTGYSAVALGQGNNAKGLNSAAIGLKSQALAQSAIALGKQVISNGIGSITMGISDNVPDVDKTPIELYTNWKTSKFALALGNGNIAAGYNCLALYGTGSVALGKDSAAQAINSVAIGTGITTEGQNQVGLGKYNVIDTTSLFVIGNGTDDSNRSNALKLDTNANLRISGKELSLGNLCLKTSNDSAISIGSSTVDSTAEHSLALGQNSYAYDRWSVALGKSCKAYSMANIAIGYNCISGDEATKGTHSYNVGLGAIAMGWENQALSPMSVALGQGNITNFNGQVLLGRHTNPEADTVFAVGIGTSANNRINAFSVNSSGQALLNSADILDDEKAIVTKKYVDNKSYNWKDIKDAPDISTDSNYTTKISGTNVYAYAYSNLDLNSSVITNIYANGNVNIGSSNININSHESTTIESPYGTVAVKNLVDPIKDTDAANKKYVDTLLPLNKGQGNNAFQQTLDYDRFTPANIYVQLNNDILKDESGNVLGGAFGDYSATFSGTAQAKGKRAIAEGSCTVALGKYSHAEGNETLAQGNHSHVEGLMTTAGGEGGHAEGTETRASGEFTHAEGKGSEALGPYSHAEGIDTSADGSASHAEGSGSAAGGTGAHAEGINTSAQGEGSHT